VSYANAWIESVSRLLASHPFPERVLADLRRRLAARVHHWKAEARHYRVEQEARAAAAPAEVQRPPRMAPAAARTSTLQTGDVSADHARLPPLETEEERRTAVNDKLALVSQDTDEPLRHDADFWKAAKQYQNRRSFEDWLKKGPAAPSAHQAFCRVLLLPTVDFVAASRQWRKKPKRGSEKKTTA
jgi:hypothetical protein